MADLDTVARRAGQAARTEARARARRMSLPGQRMTVRSPGRGPALAGIAVLAVVALVVVGGRLLVGPGLVIEPVGPAEQPGALSVPEVGSVTAGYLEDGTPVFASHPVQGTLLVLDATSPHQENKLVAYCESSVLFEDLYHGSRFTGWGDWIGGPSPTGLGVYPHEVLADGRQVRVTGPAGPGSERTQPRGPDGIEPQGPSCEPGFDDLSAAVGHRLPGEPRALDGAEVPSDRWVWARLVTGGSFTDPRVCDTDGSCPPDAPRALPSIGTSEVAEQLWEPTDAVYLARATDDGAVLLRRPALPIDGPEQQWPQGLLPVPGPGEVLAVYGWQDRPLFVVTDEDDSTLVFDATSSRHPTDLLGWCSDESRFVDGSGAVYDRSGQAVDDGAPMHRYDHAVSDAGRGSDRRTLRFIWGTEGWQPPIFVPEAVPRSAPQPAPCAGVIAHGSAGGGVEEVTNARFDTVFSSRWVQTTAREIDGALRLCLGNGACDDADPIIVSDGAGTVAWPQDPQLLHVHRDDWSADSAENDHEPHRVHIRRPILPQS